MESAVLLTKLTGREEGGRRKRWKHVSVFNTSMEERLLLPSRARAGKVMSLSMLAVTAVMVALDDGERMVDV